MTIQLNFPDGHVEAITVREAKTTLHYMSILTRIAKALMDQETPIKVKRLRVEFDSKKERVEVFVT